MPDPKLCLIVIISPFEVGAEKAEEILRNALSKLKKLRLEIISTPIVKDEKTALKAGEILKKNNVDLICVIEGTWSEDHLVLDILEIVDVPVITWALPGIHTGSLCGCQQLCCVLKELGKPYKFVYGELENPDVHKEIEIYSSAVGLKKVLRRMKLGFVGYRIKGMTEISFDEYEMKSLFGPRIVHTGIDEIKDSMSKFSEGEIKRIWGNVKKKVGKIKANEEDGLHSTRTYLALKKFIKENDLCGVAIECYPALMGEVCLASSLLSEEGIVVGCEGDMNSTLVMFILRFLTGAPVHNTDLLSVNEKDDSVVLSHCGSSGFSLAEDSSKITLGPVRLANKGVCVLFPSKPGPVTMINLVGRKDTYRMCIVEGEAIKTGMVFPGNPIKVKIPISIQEFLNLIAEQGFGHHWMIGYGKVGKKLEEFCSLIGLKYKFIKFTS